MKKRQIALFVLSILLLMSCNKNDNIVSGVAGDNAVTMSFYAGIESYPDSLQTRTTLGGKVSDNIRKVLWLPEDNIYVTNGSTGAKFTNIKNDTVNIAEFEGSISPGDNYFAVYPYSMVTGYSSSQFQITLPSVQQYVKDGIATESFPMVAQCKDNQFNFRNVCGIFVLNLTGEDVIDSIRFSGTDTTSKAIKVSGTGTIRSDYGDCPVLNMASTANNSITLNCIDNKDNKGVSLNKKSPTAFNFVLPVCTFSSFELEIFSKGKKDGIIRSEKAMTIRRSERTTTSTLEYISFVPEYVDLGLSVKWATCNIGSFKPEEYGDYFAWGETEPYYEPGFAQSSFPKWKSGKSSGYSWASYFDNMDDDGHIFNKYNNDGGKIILDPEDDAAHVNWGGDWRMPTMSEFQELIDLCTWSLTTQNDVRGYVVQCNTNSNFIFIPAAGERSEQKLSEVGGYGSYWTSSLNSTPSFAAMMFSTSKGGRFFGMYRSLGCTIRPVYAPVIHITSLSLNISELEVLVGETETLTATVYPENATNKSIIWSSSDESVATVDQTGKITAITTGTCTITATCENKYASCTITVFDLGHEYVDLGLPSGILWATCNIGAEKPEEYGDYFAWGEIQPRSSFDWSSYKYSGNTFTSLTKYCSDSYYGIVDNKVILDLADDAAHVIWGNNWRVPTPAEFRELLDNCTLSWIKMNDVDGVQVKSDINNNTIFLPATGYTRTGGRGRFYDDGNYWSSYSNAAMATILNIHKPGNPATISLYSRGEYGLTIRPVYSRNASSGIIGISINKSTLSLEIGADETLIPIVEKEESAINDYVEWTSSNESIAKVDNNGKVTAIAAGTATITARTVFGGYSARCIVSITKAHEYVDLGLSVKWATCNVGADSPTDYGNHYAWGETQSKSDFSWGSYKYYNGSKYTFTKYNSDGEYSLKIVLELEDDAAHVNWGGDWRMPTAYELTELQDDSNCTWTWYDSDNIEFGGIAGFKVTSLKSGYEGNFIFLPAAGYSYNRNFCDVGSYGSYWSSSLYSNSRYNNIMDGSQAGYLDFGLDYHYTTVVNYYRYHGLSVRPVCE